MRAVSEPADIDARAIAAVSEEAPVCRRMWLRILSAWPTLEILFARIPTGDEAAEEEEHKV